MNKEQIIQLLDGIRCISDSLGSILDYLNSQKCVASSNKNRSRYRGFIKRRISPSAVVPDETYTIRELFERAVCNSMPDVSRPFYAEESSDPSVLLNQEVVDFSTLDLVELEEYKKRLDSHIERKKNLVLSLSSAPRDESQE